MNFCLRNQRRTNQLI